jgi:predicted alpha/beta-hydrolase family hydrolase
MEAAMPAQSGRVLMLPGFGGEASQPILVALDVALRERGISALRGSLRRGRPSPGLRQEVEDARRQMADGPAVSAYAGRSFGGRVLARLALEVTPRALVLLGFPLRSATGRSRPDDEAVLERLACPTLIVQGAADPLGPIRMLERLAGTNPRLELEVVRGASHAFGRHQRRAVEVAADWLAGRLS